MTAAQRTQLAAEIDAYAERVVAVAPPFTPQQKERLRSILAPAYARVIARRAAQAKAA